MAQFNMEDEAAVLYAKFIDRCHSGISSDAYKPFVGPIEVKHCPNKSHGRGLFLTEDVAAGDLLLCEQAFSVVLQLNDSQGTGAITSGGINLGSDEFSPEQARLALSFDCSTKLQQDPSRVTAIMDLYAGIYQASSNGEGEEASIEDDVHVHHIVLWNCFYFPLSSKEYHLLLNNNPAQALDYCDSVGLWILASYMNHSCVPNTQRSHIGDMMVIRAGSDLAIGTELTHTYVDLSKGYLERQEILRKYGFQCNCSMCSAYMSTSNKKKKKRAKVTKEIFELFTNTYLPSLDYCEEMLDRLEATYTHSASEEPRLEMPFALTQLIPICSRQGCPWNIWTLVDRYLDVLGFQVQASRISCEVKKWGNVDDFVVLVLIALWKALGSSAPRICADVEAILKSTYKMVVGEEESFEAVHGRVRPDFTTWGPHTKLEEYAPDSIVRIMVQHRYVRKDRLRLVWTG